MQVIKKISRLLMQRKWLMALIITLAIAYNYTWEHNLLLKKSSGAPLCIGLYCEPQVILDCKASTIKLQPCQKISANLWRWINSHGYAAIKKGYQAAGYSGKIKSAVIYCNKGIFNKKRIFGRRWSQHTFRRACDGNKIIVNNKVFTYSGRGVKRPKTKSDYFFKAFLDRWGTIGFGINVASTIPLIDLNRGVRDCREDRRHCAHYHISKPCYMCIFTGTMGYE